MGPKYIENIKKGNHFSFFGYGRKYQCILMQFEKKNVKKNIVVIINFSNKIERKA